MNAIADFQPELIQREEAARSTVTPEAIAELCGLLRGRGWMTARELREKRPQWSKRFIRLLASASRSVISAPGTRGYCLADEVTDDELLHAGRSNIAQGRDMVHRGIRFLRLHALRRKTAQLATP